MKVRAEALAFALSRLPVAGTYSEKVVVIPIPEHRAPLAADFDYSKPVETAESFQRLVFRLTPFARGARRWHEYVLEVAEG